MITQDPEKSRPSIRSVLATADFIPSRLKEGPSKQLVIIYDGENRPSNSFLILFYHASYEIQLLNVRKTSIEDLHEILTNSEIPTVVMSRRIVPTSESSGFYAQDLKDYTHQIRPKTPYIVYEESSSPFQLKRSADNALGIGISRKNFDRPGSTTYKPFAQLASTTPRK